MPAVVGHIRAGTLKGQRISTEMRAVLAMPAVHARYAELSADAPAMTPAQCIGFVRDEVRVWGEVVRATGVRAE
jgi:tripartite-type tricarboxylate transporter receptor subunit TctC